MSAPPVPLSSFTYRKTLVVRAKLFTRMARVKTPQQKKKDSYAHDRVEGGEYPHADRKNRPRVKAFGQRELRRISKATACPARPKRCLQLPDRPRWTWHKKQRSPPGALRVDPKATHRARSAQHIPEKGTLRRRTPGFGACCSRGCGVARNTPHLWRSFP